MIHPAFSCLSPVVSSLPAVLWHGDQGTEKKHACWRANTQMPACFPAYANMLLTHTLARVCWPHAGMLPRTCPHTFAHMPACRGAQGRRWAHMVAAPMLVAGAEWLPSLAKLGSAAAVARARPAILRSLATRLAVQSRKCDAALRLLYRQGAKSALKGQLQLQVLTFIKHEGK